MPWGRLGASAAMALRTSRETVMVLALGSLLAVSVTADTPSTRASCWASPAYRRWLRRRERSVGSGRDIGRGLSPIPAQVDNSFCKAQYNYTSGVASLWQPLPGRQMLRLHTTVV